MGGVARFEGVRFTVFDGGNTSELKSDLTNAVVPEPDGAVWIGTEAGLARRDAAGHFTRFTAPAGIAVSLATRLERTRRGDLWIDAWTGEKILAVDRLALAEARCGPVTHGQLKLHPVRDDLRGDARFEALVTSLGPKPGR